MVNKNYIFICIFIFSVLLVYYVLKNYTKESFKPSCGAHFGRRTDNCGRYHKNKGGNENDCNSRWQHAAHTGGKGPLKCKWSGNKCKTGDSCSESAAQAFENAQAQIAAAQRAAAAAQAEEEAKNNAINEQCKMNLNKQYENQKWIFQGVENDCPNYEAPMPSCIINQADSIYDKSNTKLEINNVPENNISEQDSYGYVHDQTKCVYYGCTDPNASNYALLPDSDKGTVTMNNDCKYPPVEKEIVEVEKIVYVDKPVEKIVYVDKPVEKIVYVDKPVEVEKTVYVDKPVEVEKTVYVDKLVDKHHYVGPNVDGRFFNP